MGLDWGEFTVDVGEQHIWSWDEDGKEFQGIYRGLEDSTKYPDGNKLALFDLDDGRRIRVSAGKVLLRKLQLIRIGARVRVWDLGMVTPAGGGKPYRDTKVRVTKSEDLLPVHAGDRQPGDDGIPF